METKNLGEILSWMKKTDLVEMSFRRGSDGFEFKNENAPRHETPFAASTLVPVTSPAVGIFMWNTPGAPRKVEEGQSVAAGSALGIVEMGTKPVPVTAASAGRIVKILAEEGRPVEYGQPLFLIAP